MINTENIFNALNRLTGKLSASLDNVVPGLLLVILSFLVALAVEFAIRILIRLIRLDKLMEKSSLVHSLESLGIKPRIHIYGGKLFFWITFLILLEASAHAVGWRSITSKFEEYLELVPLLIGAAVIFTVGLFISKFIRDLMRGILIRAQSKAAELISKISYYALIALTFTIALGYIGLDTYIITANISIILGSILFAFSLAFVFASKDLLSNILSSSYNKSNFKVGQKISIDGKEGEIIKITNTSVYVKATTKINVIPAKKFTEQTVEIIG